jgi:hypothetical protein
MSRGLEKWEYGTSYFPVEYEAMQIPGLIFKSKGGPAHPIPESILQNKAYNEHVDQMGESGWEMTAVQPLIRAVVHPGSKDQPPLAYAITAGFMFFWKRRQLPAD